jgi:hypothetical protein
MVQGRVFTRRLVRSQRVEPVWDVGARAWTSGPPFILNLAPRFAVSPSALTSQFSDTSARQATFDRIVKGPGVLSDRLLANQS